MLQRIKQLIFENFTAPRRRPAAINLLVSVMSDLVVLRQKLNRLLGAMSRPNTHPADKIPLIVEFFQLVSPWSDRGLQDLVIAFEFAGDVPVALTTLRRHFQNSGRNEYGYNRTSVGQVVTNDNVWLGDRCGLWTKPVSHWLTLREDRGHVFTATNGESMTCCDVIWWQAGEFLDSHVASICNMIDDLERIQNGEERQFKTPVEV